MDGERADLIELRASVATMRELGVLQWNGITLGPAPLTAPEAKPAQDDPLAERRAHYANLLGRPVTDEEVSRYP